MRPAGHRGAEVEQQVVEQHKLAVAVRQQSVSRPSSGCWSARLSAARDESGP
jgi:hypothetical protein